MREESFTIIPNYILEDEELSANEKIFLITIISYINRKSGIAYPSYKQIRKRSSIKKDTTIKNIADLLEEKGYISKEIIVGKGIKYKILPPTSLEVPPKLGTPKKEVTPPPKKEVHPLPKGSTTNKNTNTKTKTIYINLKFISEILEHVKLTKVEYKALKDKYGETIVHKKIKDLDNYIANGKGRNYTSHYRTLMGWIEKEYKGNETKSYLLTNNYVEEGLV